MSRSFRSTKQKFSETNRLPRMSWHPLNLQALLDPPAIKMGRKTVYQQKWMAKASLRAYHIPNITERQFLDRHFKTALPIRIHSEENRKLLPPIQSIMFGQLERRLDCVVFRSLFASSIFNSRQMVIHGHVKVNGEECRYPARALEDGDMITVNPAAILMLQPAPKGKKKNAVSDKIAKSGSENIEVVLSEPQNDTTAPLPFRHIPYMAPSIFIPVYIEVSFATCSAVFLRSPLSQPRIVEIPSPFPPLMHQLCYEWYAARKKTSQKPILKPQIVINNQHVMLKPKFDTLVRRIQIRDAKRVKRTLKENELLQQLRDDSMTERKEKQDELLETQI